MSLEILFPFSYQSQDATTHLKALNLYFHDKFYQGLLGIAWIRPLGHESHAVVCKGLKGLLTTFLDGPGGIRKVGQYNLPKDDHLLGRGVGEMYPASQI